MKAIYLDYNATSPVAPEVYQEMIPYLTTEYGNPSNSYALGYHAKEAVTNARKKVATLIGAQPNEVLFTSCGSESNNMVIKGVAYTYKGKGKHIISTKIEHPSVLEPLHFLERNGYEVSYVGVDFLGRVDPEDIRNLLRPDTILVSVMHSNNEVGTLQPIKEIGAVCKEKHILFHCDASQSTGKVPLDVKELNVDFLTIAGHKLYAPKGIGALYTRQGIIIEPLIHGASQESSHRAGTENVPYIVALGKAAELAQEQLKTFHLKDIKDYFFTKLHDSFGEAIHVNGDYENSLPNTLNISFIGKVGSEVLARVPQINASTGSACHSGSKTISPVLAAMGIHPEVALGAIRFSVGRYTTKANIDEAVMYLESYIISK
ncbi:MAG TPA: cysteine desulfurase [Petrimonas sp.]|uniref:cysteine desulfurase family protein n=1 Tax=Petrimonas sp. TaxID=2023866 RepID=UPI001774FF6F|nr:cysteine desulfurase [Petrimonas sp.]